MYVIANWKQNKTIDEVNSWFEKFPVSDFSNIKVIIAPAFPLIPVVKEKVTESGLSGNFHIGSQDISEFDDGAHTGETGGNQLKGLVKYAIIGHSERRINGETVSQVNNKIKNAKKFGIIPIVCFSNIEEFNAIDNGLLQSGEVLFAYEPASAISTAENSSGPAEITEVKDMCDRTGLASVIYGGSVDSDSISEYLKADFINGFLIGSASLDSTKFSYIINQIIPSNQE